MITKDTLHKTIKLLTEFEGYRNEPYDDYNGKVCNNYSKAKGNLTIGVGHKLIKGEDDWMLNNSISDTLIRTMLVNDIFKHEPIAQRTFIHYENLTQSKKIFTLLMVFNIGNRISSFKKANKHFNNLRYGKAMEEYKNSLWFNQVGKNRATKTIELLRY